MLTTLAMLAMLVVLPIYISGKIENNHLTVEKRIESLPTWGIVIVLFFTLSIASLTVYSQSKPTMESCHITSNAVDKTCNFFILLGSGYTEVYVYYNIHLITSNTSGLAYFKCTNNKGDNCKCLDNTTYTRGSVKCCHNDGIFPTYQLNDVCDNGLLGTQLTILLIIGVCCLIVGIASCVFGLFLYITKKYEMYTEL